MRAGGIAHCIDHGHHDKAEGHADADMADGAVADTVHDDGAAAGKHQSEGANEFCNQGSVHAWILTQCVVASVTILPGWR